MAVPPLVRVIGLGLATGGRASVAFTALSESATSTDPDWLGSPWAKGVTALSSVGETIGDKLPRTPSRLAAGGLVPRVVIGALGGGLLGRRHSASVPTAVVLGAAAAFGGCHLGARWRAWASGRIGHDLPGALVEDAAVAGLAGFAVR